MHKPGQKAPESGQYGVVGPKGGKTGTEVTKPCRQRQSPARDLSWWTRPNTKMTNDFAKDDASQGLLRMNTFDVVFRHGLFS